MQEVFQSTTHILTASTEGWLCSMPTPHSAACTAVLVANKAHDDCLDTQYA